MSAIPTNREYYRELERQQRHQPRTTDELWCERCHHWYTVTLGEGSCPTCQGPLRNGRVSDDA